MSNKDIERLHSSNPEHNKVASKVTITEEGFVIGGRNETSSIAALTTFCGEPISQLEKRIKSAGFLNKKQQLIDVLATDNTAVLEMGLTHQQIAGIIQNFDEAEGMMLGDYASWGVVNIGGEKFAHTRIDWAEFRNSPFEDGAYTNRTHTIINLKTGASIKYSGLLPQMIQMYGFYGGLDPEKVAEVAGIIPPTADDPVIKLVQDKNAKVDITTAEQLVRIENLYLASEDVLMGQNYRIVPEDLIVLFKLIDSVFSRYPVTEKQKNTQEQLERQRHIVSRVDTQNITPKSYLLSNKFLYFLTNIIPSKFPGCKETVLQGIERLEITDSIESYTLQDLLDKANGVSKGNPHEAYFKALLEKLNLSNSTKARLSRKKGNFDEYSSTLKNATRYAQDIVGLEKVSDKDMETLLDVIDATRVDPSRQFTPDELKAMNRLKVDLNHLLQFALKVDPNLSQDRIVAQLYRYSYNACKEQELEQAMSRLPNNLNEQAKIAVRTIIKSYSKKINIDDFVEKVTSRAEDLKSKDNIHVQQVTESDVLTDYVELRFPQVGKILTHPLFNKNLTTSAGSSFPFTINIDSEVLESLPVTEIKVPGSNTTKKYQILTVGEQIYTINQDGIREGEPEDDFQHRPLILDFIDGTKIHPFTKGTQVYPFTLR